MRGLPLPKRNESPLMSFSSIEYLIIGFSGKIETYLIEEITL